MKHRQIFGLKVEIINQNCRFDLSWGEAQQIESIYVIYPQELNHYYQSWQRAYIRYYQNNLRGRIVDQGSFNSMNLHGKLINAEVKLLNQFKTWLRSEKLAVIRTKIATLIKEWQQKKLDFQIDIFLTCSSLELERLPWEAWELEKEIASPVVIHLLRTAKNISSHPAVPRNENRRGGARILAIFGDETGLDFSKDINALNALNSLPSIAEIKTIAWYKDKSIDQHKEEICQQISDKKGWDMLFFAGHTQENLEIGGEIAIAPGTTLSIRELEPYLKIAQAKGLQFTLFNSCSGLSIANALIDLGFNQVAIMREPIQNTVAQVFLKKFLEVLGEEKDVSEALRETCQFLQREKNLNYPSAYLIPSLFGHPSATFYKIEPFGWKAYYKRWLPNRQQLLVLSSLVLLSLFPSIQQSLLNLRTLIQAIYRDITHQIPPNTTPPVLLVSIDQDSLNAAKITQFNPLNRQYLAQIIDQLSKLDAKVIGIDYLLDRPQDKNDLILAKSIQKSRQKQKTSFIFAAIIEGDQELGIIPEIASLNDVMQGSILASPPYLTMPDDCYSTCPFGYLIAVNYVLYDSEKFTEQSDYKTQVFNTLYREKKQDNLSNFLKEAKVNPLTQVSEYFQQQWLQPIIDFSLPPDAVYQTLSARQLFTEKKPIDGQVVLIASGGYGEAGIDGEEDYFEPPLAISFWHPDIAKFTGGEINAYMIHHWLNQHLVIPIPNLWLILVAVGLGQVIVIHLDSSSRLSKYLIFKLASVNCLYFVFSLQVYITLKILLPLLLPSLAFWLYILPSLRNTSYEK